VAELEITALFHEILHSIKHKANTEDNDFHARMNMPQDHTKKLFEDGIPTAWFPIIKPKI